jgi:hypothetical protein
MENVSNKKYFYPLIYKYYSYLDYWIYLLLFFYFFVDWLTGVNKVYGGISPAVPYKFILMFLMTLSVGAKSQLGSKTRFKFIIIIYFYTTTFFCLLIYLFNSYSGFSDSLSMLLRIIYAPLVYIYFKTSFSTNTFSLSQIERIVKINFVCMCLNEIFGLFGYGVNTYQDNEFGIKGFIFDGNALAVMVYCMYVYFYIKNYRKKARYVLFFLVLGILIGTKVAVLSILLYTIIVPVFIYKKNYGYILDAGNDFLLIFMRDKLSYGLD